MSLSPQLSSVLIAYSEPWRLDQLCQLVAGLRPGMLVAAFSDGRSALAACRRQLPSLLILDGELEGLDGFGLLRELRRHGPSQRLPCVLISERTDAPSVRAALPLAPAAYLGKPYDLDDLRSRIDRLLPRSAGGLARGPLGDDSLDSFLERMREHCRGAPLGEAAYAAIGSLLAGQTELAEEHAVLLGDPQVTARAISFANSHGPQQAQPSQTLAQAFERLGRTRSGELLAQLASQHNARLSDPQLAGLAGRLADQALLAAQLAAWLARRLQLDAAACHTAALLHNIGELALLRTLQDWLDSGGALQPDDLPRQLALRAAGYGSALRARWRLPLGLRQLISAYYALGSGVLGREALVLNLARQLLELPADRPATALAGCRAARLLRLDAAVLEQAPRALRD
ncbi:HDOD domain-containing protein [Pseudomonas oligotrophica]|uniref:HDOD domain-containing protein n=1 Tax=Pseudomonas oligotrophica TaxID=2912055 RepID=UPI001F357FD4|nr:HDOD domain-containing protein [Pseudomonas oligotrophica]